MYNIYRCESPNMGPCCVQYVLIYSFHVFFCIFILCKTYYLKAMISGEILIPFNFKEVIIIAFSCQLL